MITARPQKDLNSAKTYFRQHLLRGDYHSENRSIQGQWFGKGAERLGLSLTAPVTEEAFVRLCENRHPLTGAQLTVRHRRKDRRVFYDFVASAPKSVAGARRGQRQPATTARLCTCPAPVGQSQSMGVQL